MKNQKYHNFIPCIVCGQKATWSYMLGDDNFCDKHVPRGCSCNCDENGKEELDEQGRKQPCCEYHQITDDQHNDEEQVLIGWDTYYKHNPEKETSETEVEYWSEKFGDENFEPIRKGKKLQW